MSRRLKLKSKDAAAMHEFGKRLRAALGNNLIEVKLFGSKATGKDQPDSDTDVLGDAKRRQADFHPDRRDWKKLNRCRAKVQRICEIAELRSP